METSGTVIAAPNSETKTVTQKPTGSNLRDKRAGDRSEEAIGRDQEPEATSNSVISLTDPLPPLRC